MGMKFTLTSAALILFLSTGCRELKLSTADITDGFNFGKQIYEASKDITQEQEYYVGRSVAANVLGRYKLYDNAEATAYVGDIGALLAINSKQPEIFGGYHFAILDSDEINAFATPGGFVFVTRGVLRLCKSEDELAAILAHEISHVQLKHGIGSVKDNRWTDVATTLGSKAVKKYGNKELVQLTKSFEDSISDIANALVVNGYSRSYEYEADEYSLGMLRKSAYDDSATLRVLSSMDDRLKDDALGFGSTHPKASDRLEAIGKLIQKQNGAIPTVRVQRFKSYMKNV